MLLPNPSPFLEQFLLTKLSQREVKDWLQTYARPYRELMSCYRCAMMEIETKFNVLNEELSLQYDRNPIETIKTRLKSPESILEKLQRKGLPLTVESIEKNLSDIAGVRVICSHPAPAQGLHREPQAQRLPEPAPHRGDPHLPPRREAPHAGGGAVPHHLHGLVGQP